MDLDLLAKLIFGLATLIAQVLVARIRASDRQRVLQSCEACRTRIEHLEPPRHVPPAMVPVVLVSAMLLAPGCRDLALTLWRPGGSVSLAAKKPRPLAPVARKCDDNNPCPKGLKCVNGECVGNATEKRPVVARPPSEDSEPTTRPVPVDPATEQQLRLVSPIGW